MRAGLRLLLLIHGLWWGVNGLVAAEQSTALCLSLLIAATGMLISAAWLGPRRRWAWGVAIGSLGLAALPWLLLGAAVLRDGDWAQTGLPLAYVVESLGLAGLIAYARPRVSSVQPEHGQ